MAAKYQAPWQCSKQTCAKNNGICNIKPSVSLVTSLDKTYKTYIQIESKQFLTL